LTNISTESEMFKEITSQIILAMSDISDQTTNDKVVDIFKSYSKDEDDLIRVRVSSIVFEGGKGQKETYTCYVTLYLHGFEVNRRADILRIFLKDGAATEIFQRNQMKLGEITKYRDASRSLGRGSIEDRSSFSFSLILEKSLKPFKSYN
jgi:hypothetical protein